MKLRRIKNGTGSRRMGSRRMFTSAWLRGGGWYSDASYLRAAYRDYDSPSTQYANIGARLFRRIKTKKRQR